jgi:hypothetical protein
VVILAAFALAWTGAMTRGSWVGIVGVLGASLVMVWTAMENWLDSRDVVGASVGHGLVLVVAASAVLAGLAIRAAVLRVRTPAEADRQPAA